MKILTANWMVLLLSAIVYLGATVAFLKIPAVTAGAASGPGEGNIIQPPVPSWEFSNPEADQLIAELKAEKKNLGIREQQIGELTQRLQTERSELMQATQMVAQLQSEFDKSALRVQQEEAANLKKLAKTYAVMSPENAAAILSEMEDSAIVKIMLFMKVDENGAILEALAKKGELQARRAADISERLRIATVNKAPATP